MLICPQNNNNDPKISFDGDFFRCENQNDLLSVAIWPGAQCVPGVFGRYPVGVDLAKLDCMCSR